MGRQTSRSYTYYTLPKQAPGYATVSQGEKWMVVWEIHLKIDDKLVTINHRSYDMPPDKRQFLFDSKEEAFAAMIADSDEDDAFRAARRKRLDGLSIEERNRQMAERRAKGATYRVLAREYDLSPGRVAQLINRDTNKAKFWADRRKALTSDAIDAATQNKLLSVTAMEVNKSTDTRILAAMDNRVWKKARWVEGVFEEGGWFKNPSLTIDDLAKKTDPELLGMGNFGPHSIRRLRALTNTYRPAEIKLSAWQKKHMAACDRLRASAGVDRFGEGLAALKEMEQSDDPVQREFAATLHKLARECFWSMNQFDAMIAVYWANPLMKRMMQATAEARKTGESPFTEPVLKVVGESKE